MEDPNKEYRMMHCLKFIKRNFPQYDEETQKLLAEASYLTYEALFKEVIPIIITRNLAFSDN